MSGAQRGRDAVLTGSTLLGVAVAAQFLLGALPQSRVAIATEPDSQVRDFQFPALEARLKTMPPGPERDYFAGVVANREGRTDESVQLLERALPAIRASEPKRAAVGLEALADDYIKSFRYGEAARTYDDLLTSFAAQLDPKRLQGTKDDAGVMRLLRGAPAQTVTWRGPVRLKTVRNSINSLNAELTVNGVPEWWLLDTGANFSVVTRSFAARLGLTPLPGVAQTGSGITGIENPLQVAVLPTLPVGGAELHNVVILILDDTALKVTIPNAAYQINGIIGYPVFQALGAVTFLRDAWFEAGESARRQGSGAVRMYMKLLTPVILCGVKGHELPFTFDTGASGTELSVRYFERFHDQIGSWKKRLTQSYGAGGIVTRQVYLQPSLDLTVGDKRVSLGDVSISPTRLGSALDELYGNLGQDVVAAFDGFTLDFARMTFSLGAPLPNPFSN